MAEITVESVNAKLEKGENLTKEESKFVMSLPPDKGENNKPGEEEEDIDWNEAEGEEKKEESKEEEEKGKSKDKKNEEEAKEEPAEKESPEPAAEKEKEEPADPLLKIETELQKPEGKEDLSKFTDREKAYFHQMRRDRKKRQEAEEERDKVLFREAQRKQQETEKTAEEPDLLVDLKKKDPEDFLTVKEVIGIMDKAFKKPAPPKEEDKPKREPDNAVRARYLKMCDDEAREAHPEDYDAVMELTDEIVSKNKDYLVTIDGAVLRGENPAEVAYHLIKNDPVFSKLYPAAETKVKARKALEKPEETAEEKAKREEAQKNQDALEKNKTKTKTTGHAGGEGAGAGESDKIEGYSINDIMKMSDLQFAKLPKKTREKFLQAVG